MAEEIELPLRNNRYLKFVGFCFMVLNKIRHEVKGYTTPRTFSQEDIERNVNYSYNVVNNWEEQLKKYSGNPEPFAGKSVLELGPGPDLGTGIILIAKGALKYTAVDKYKLVGKTQWAFYEALGNKIKEQPCYERAVSAMASYRDSNRFESDYFTYLHDERLTYEKIPSKSVDLLVTQAALEHFEDINGVLKRLKRVFKPEALTVSEIDFATHTRIINKLDPLNILRYSDRIYNALKFGGSPNRLIVSDYVAAFKDNGWDDFSVKPIKVLADKYMAHLVPSLAKRFQKYQSDELRNLSAYFLAEFNK